MLNKLYESDQFRKDVKEFTDRIKTIDSQEKRSRAFGMLDNIRDLVLEIDKAHSICLLYTSPSPRDGLLSRMPSSA